MLVKYCNAKCQKNHWPSGHFTAMKNMLVAFNKGVASRESIDSTLAAYNTSCAGMRSEARDVCIQIIQESFKL
jgi:hypothetical protein